ncbi:MAG: cytochrome c family protein [Candidatus Symbiobacter sp.]|nr:cytochrome c family protein [Candidatus Symbiobacter sp.]
MVDKLFVNKLAAAVILALMVLKLSEFIGDSFVKPREIEKNAYIVANVAPPAGGGDKNAADGNAPADANAAMPPVMPLLAKASGSNGENVAKKCMACHTIAKGGPNRVGPNLWGALGRPAASVEGYSYSSALQGQKGKVWDFERMNHFLAAPQKFVPGTKMAFVGIAKAEDRADIIVYLRSMSDSPMPMPK